MQSASLVQESSPAACSVLDSAGAALAMLSDGVSVVMVIFGVTLLGAATGCCSTVVGAEHPTTAITDIHKSAARPLA